MKRKTLVIYHSADFDGLCCREIARYWLKPEERDLTFTGWNFGQPKIPAPTEGDIFILDLSPQCLEHVPPDLLPRLVWIDHHRSAIEQYSDVEIPGYRVDGVAACRLAWQWFSGAVKLPTTTADFIERSLTEPVLIRLIGEYDVWDHRDPRAVPLQFGLRCEEFSQDVFLKCLLHPGYVESRIENGRSIMSYVERIDASNIRNKGFLVKFEGLKFLALNTARGNSKCFAALDVVSTGHDALMTLNWNGEYWNLSLYHARHNTGIDLSMIARNFVAPNGVRGGGHPGACGFQQRELPFDVSACSQIPKQPMKTENI